MKIFLVLLINCFPVFAFAQKIVYKGRIIDKETQKAIVYAHVAIKSSSYGTYANETGYYEIECSKNDSLVFSCVGYEKKLLPVSTIIEQNTILVFLSPKTVYLQEVSITNRKKIAVKQLGFYNKEITFYKIVREREYVVFLENPINREGKILQLLYKTRKTVTKEESDLTFKKLLIRLKVYQKNPKTHQPDQELLNQTLLIESKTYRNNFIINVKKHNIYFPAEGAFIGIEIVGYIDKNNQHISINTNDIRRNLNLSIPFSEIEEDVAVGTIYNDGLGWGMNNRNLPHHEIKYAVPLFGAKIEFYE